MPNLNLTDTEMENLFTLLSIHSTGSGYSTFSIYEKVSADYPGGVDTNVYNRNWAVRNSMKILSNKLIEFEKPPEPDPTNPFVDYLIGSLDEDEADWEEVDENTFQLFIDDKMVTVTVSEPEVYP